MSDQSTQQNGGLAEPRRVEASAIIGGPPAPPLRVSLERPQRQRPEDVNPLWPTIRQRTNAIGFERYHDFIERVFCGSGDTSSRQDDPCEKHPRAQERRLREREERLLQNFTGVGAYNLLRTATEVFLLLECGVFLRESDIVPGEEFDRMGVALTPAGAAGQADGVSGRWAAAVPEADHCERALGQRRSEQPVLRGDLRPARAGVFGAVPAGTDLVVLA